MAAHAMPGAFQFVVVVTGSALAFFSFFFFFSFLNVFICCCFCFVFVGGGGLICEYRLFFKNSKTYLNCYNNSNNNKTTTTTTTKWLNHFHAVFCLFLFCCFVVLVFCFVFHSFPLTECGIYCKSVYRNAVRHFSFNHISTPAPKG